LTDNYDRVFASVYVEATWQAYDYYMRAVDAFGEFRQLKCSHEAPKGWNKNAGRFERNISWPGVIGRPLMRR